MHLPMIFDVLTEVQRKIQAGMDVEADGTQLAFGTEVLRYL